MKEHICPVCGGDQIKDITPIKKKMKEAGLNGNLCNPGGRQLRFKSIGEEWLQISDMCNECDAKEILDFIKKKDEKV